MSESTIYAGCNCTCGYGSNDWNEGEAGMASEPLRRVERVVSTHDITWLLDLAKNEQLNLDPPYQRKSVWTTKDRRFFMDTVFRNYPSPAIFLHKTIDDTTGNTTYHVVDGKQRILTVLLYVENRFALSDDFGDTRFAGRRWRDLDPTARRLLWNYRLTIEELDDASIIDVNDVFSRLNKNANKLNAQELRHARFDGWLISFLEEEATESVWRTFKVRTAAKEKRMSDVQNISELAAVILRKDISGFSQEDLDRLYADHDAPEAEETEFDTEEFREEFLQTRRVLERLEESYQLVSRHAQPFYNLYILWTALWRNRLEETQLEAFAERYESFMNAVQALEVNDANYGTPPVNALNDFDLQVAAYKAASVGATTEEPQRRVRLNALEAALFPTAQLAANED
ncbi:hypothetical protein Lfu02_49930 [Longispora fulva]|uniref:GmrSD restriction endonucleases N-terminal domain-containing protein n=1 Tax=Longispora fulva TaxID=619741 RepID=A0A8J7GG69_9ACTN|nr:DUF262 domain-containing protein [Longispora fulva]MBG6138369.1 hypothetical protein [Longispora fulva]GIG60621.1 hypothetical protein Lfu02_49930 [Longispora fulva]